MGYRFQGPQGIGVGGSDKIDSGTLVQEASHPPGVVSGDTFVKQRSGSTNPSIDLLQPGKLCEIFFHTNEHVLDKDDKRELDKLCFKLKDRLKEGYRLDIRCTGGADHRAKEAYNLKLGDRRAKSVKEYITAAVPHSGLRVSKESDGESKAAQPGQGQKRVSHQRMVFDRRVDVTLDNIVTPVRIGITGNWNHTGQLQVMEINANGDIRQSTADRVTVIIKTHYQVVGVKGGRKHQVGCTVTRVDTNTLLFRVSETVDADSVTMRKGTKSHPGSGVTRLVLPGDRSPQMEGKMVEVPNVPDRSSPAGQAPELVPIIFAALKGTHNNITSHVNEWMNPTEAVAKN